MSVFLIVRVLHVLGAALWLGSIVFIAMILMPTLDRIGPDAGKVMVGLNRRGLGAYMGTISGLTLLSGIYLFWHFTGGFDPTISGSRSGIVYSIGAVLGLAASIIGGSVVGRSASKAATLIDQMAAMGASADRTALLAQVQRHRQRMVSFGHVVIVLLVATIALMAIGHYV